MEWSELCLQLWCNIYSQWNGITDGHEPLVWFMLFDFYEATLVKCCYNFNYELNRKYSQFVLKKQNKTKTTTKWTNKQKTALSTEDNQISYTKCSVYRRYLNTLVCILMIVYWRLLRLAEKIGSNSTPSISFTFFTYSKHIQDRSDLDFKFHPGMAFILCAPFFMCILFSA